MKRATLMLSLAAALVGVLAGPSAKAGPVPKVVVSLKPIHALVAAIMEGAGTPRLIVQGAASEHLYVMRPSDAAALQSADAVFWVGPVMEDYLIRPLAALSGHAQIVTLMEEPALKRLPLRAGGVFEPDEDEKQNNGAVFDGHLWLDPQNARAIGALAAQTLSRLDPAHARLYAANERRLDGDLAALDAALRAGLAPLRAKPFVVFHDAYQYLEARYGLTVVGSITLHPGVSASAKRVTALRARIEKTGAVCVFAEPQFEPRLLDNLIEGTKARRGVLDPLGAALTPGRGEYFALMHGLAQSLKSCLGAG